MIDVLEEQLISLRQARAEKALLDPGTGRPCHHSSIYRYAKHGASAVDGSRVKLETIKTPRGLMTSREAVARFIDALTNPGKQGERLTPAATRKRQAKVERELDAAGI